MIPALIRPACIALFVASGLLAQSDTPPPKAPRAKPGQLTEKQLEEGMKPEDLDRSKPYVGSVGFCRFKASVLPRRLSPGGRGVMVITMMPEKHFVMTAPANLSYEFKAVQGPFTLGQPQVRSPRRGSTGSIFDGQPVYDRYAVIDVPIQVDPQARHGDYFARVKVQFDLTDGKTGKLFQRFEQLAGARIKVGDPIPEGQLPDLQIGQDNEFRPAPGEPGSELLANPSGRAARGPGGSDSKGSRVVSGRTQMPTRVGGSSAEPDATVGMDGDPPVVDEGIPLPLWLAGGGILLVVVVLGVGALGKR